MSRLWTAIAILALPLGAIAQSTSRSETGSGNAAANSAVTPVANTAAPAQTGSQKEPTTIDSLQGATFDEKTRTAVFTGDVHVVDPQFRLNCDKLTAFLKKENEKVAASPTPAAKATPAASPAAGDKKTSDPASGLEKAIAEGHVVIVQDKVDNEGKVTHYVGKGTKAIYESASGDLTLTGWPQVQQGTNTQIATEENTIMIMNKDGQMRTKGRSRTVITEQSDNKDQKKK